ncbi:MAG: winged helix-turn-helix transcriptional regulator [Euryarchaeota archaeon]|nr:winged helix-turn-helix transcriptional regulator [Euryarchaeota archaeon]
MNAIKRLIWWLFAGTAGGMKRALIIKLLTEQPYNANQISEKIDLDYKTTRHHLEMLEKHYMVVAIGDKYGKMYSISPFLEDNFAVFEEIWLRIRQNDIRTSQDTGK